MKWRAQLVEGMILRTECDNRIGGSCFETGRTLRALECRDCVERTPSRASSPVAGMNNEPGHICTVMKSSLLALNRPEAPRMRRPGTTTPAGASGTESVPCSAPLMLAAFKHLWECLQHRPHGLPQPTFVPVGPAMA